jgi:regulation of enolase protein 1 (concanavalin A-like superfamily)
MNFEVKDTDWVNAPKVKESDPTKVEVYVNVTTGVVGQPYIGFSNVDTVLMDFPISMTGVEMKANTAVQAAAFSSAKYPNT